MSVGPISDEDLNFFFKSKYYVRRYRAFERERLVVLERLSRKDLIVFFLKHDCKLSRRRIAEVTGNKITQYQVSETYRKLRTPDGFLPKVSKKRNI